MKTQLCKNSISYFCFKSTYSIFIDTFFFFCLFEIARRDVVYFYSLGSQLATSGSVIIPKSRQLGCKVLTIADLKHRSVVVIHTSGEEELNALFLSGRLFQLCASRLLCEDIFFFKLKYTTLNVLCSNFFHFP